MSGSQSSDTDIPINPGTGGAQLDADNLVQSDGATAVTRERVGVGFASDDPRGRLVARGTPLPVGDRSVEDLLGEVLAELKDIKMLLYELVNE